MPQIITNWESSKPNPDEAFLKSKWQDEIKALEKSISLSPEASRNRTSALMMLMESSNIRRDDINKMIKRDADMSRKALKESEKLIAKPTIDIQSLHKKDVELAQAIAEKMKNTGNPHWQGYIWNPSYGGAWSEWEGETEEKPSVTFDVGSKRLDPRAQAFGEGWWDDDFSRMHAYMAFSFKPPAWGHLHIHTHPWVHGYYSLYSNDAWYKGEYAKADLDSWVDVHQNFWRSRQYKNRFYKKGYELHPEVSGRIDEQCSHYYYTDVGEGDTVTIRVGVRLYCEAQASGGRAKLNFQHGGANYVYTPYVYWYLHQ